MEIDDFIVDNCIDEKDVLTGDVQYGVEEEAGLGLVILELSVKGCELFGEEDAERAVFDYEVLRDVINRAQMGIVTKSGKPDENGDFQTLMKALKMFPEHDMAARLEGEGYFRPTPPEWVYDDDDKEWLALFVVTPPYATELEIPQGMDPPYSGYSKEQLEAFAAHVERVLLIHGADPEKNLDFALLTKALSDYEASTKVVRDVDIELSAKSSEPNFG